MDYRLDVKKKSSANFSQADLFPDSIVSFDLDFFDSNNIDKIKVPVSINISLPMTDNNISIIDYDPQSTTYTTVPDSAFDFRLYLNNSEVLSGNLYIESYSFNNTVPTIEIRLADKLQSIFSDAKAITLDDMYSDYDSLVSFSNFRGNYGGTIGTSPTMGSIAFPYLDMCNDIQKFDYAARQFLQFGFDKNRVGFIPAFQVSDFVKRFFDEAGVGLTSRFLDQGTVTPITGVNASDMYIALETKLEASSSTRTRGFTVVEGSYEFYKNVYTKGLEPTVSTAREKDDYPDSSLGWNYNSSISSNPVDTDYGLDFKHNLPNSYDNIDRAYFGSHMSYTAKPFIPTTPRTISSYIGFDIPLIRLSNNNFAVVNDIDKANSDAVFNIVATLWEDGNPSQTFRMCNTDGTIKDIDISNCFIEPYQGGSSTVQTSLNGFEVSVNYGGQTDWYNVDISVANTNLENNIRMTAGTIGNFIWEQKEHEIKAGSTYATSISLEMVSGSLDIEYVSAWQKHPTNPYAVIDSTASKTIDDADIAKGIYRASTGAVGELFNLLTVTGNHNPYFDDDDVNVIWGLESSDVSPYNVVKQILSRFNLSVVYDQNSDEVVVDRLPDIRSVNTTQSLDGYFDDANEMRVEIINELAKSIEIATTKKSLFYDLYGYGLQDINEAGSEELRFSLESRFYNGSLCGNETSIVIPDGFSEYEIGFTLNEFTAYNDIDIVFGYLDTPQFNTNIRRGKFTDTGDIKTLTYDVPFGHVFPRFVKTKTNRILLNHFDESGNTTSLYTFFTNNDNILYFNKPRLTFTALLDSDYAFDIKNNYSAVTIPQINSNEIIIKRVNGEIYDQGVYAEIQAIIL